MAYQNLTLKNIAGEVTAIYNDGTFRSLTPPDPTSGATAAFIGTAETGVTHEFFRHVDRSLTFREFGAGSEIAQMVQSAKISDNQLPVIVSRIGAKNYSLSLQRPTATGASELDDLVQIVPLIIQEDNASLGRENTLKTIKMILLPYVEDNLARQRLIMGVTLSNGDTTPIYDSERKLVSNGGAIFDVKLDLPVGELLITNGSLKAVDQLTFDVTGATISFEQATADATDFRTSASRLELMKELNDLTEFDWDSAETLNDIDLSNVRLLLPYEQVTIANVARAFNDAAITGTQEKIIGKANKKLSNYSKRYVGTDLAYRNLEYENVGFIYCEGCYADIESVDIDDLADGGTLQAQLTWSNKYLGNLWKFSYNGREYSYMFARQDPFATANVTDYTHGALGANAVEPAFTFSNNQKKLGDLLNLVEVHFHEGVAVDVESFVNKRGMIECHITAPDAGAPTIVYTDFFMLTVPANGFAAAGLDGEHLRLRPSLANTSVNLSAHLRKADSKDTNDDWASNDPFVMTHYDLTGQFIPEGVSNKLLTFEGGLRTADQGGNEFAATVNATKAQVREISFLHQSAQAAYKASTNYSQTLAIVPTSAPSSSANSLGEWAGEPPVYEVDSQGQLLVKTNGSGVMGTKLIAGKKDYRDDAAYGGIILTDGNNLPNAIPYGIDDTDEARDAFGQVIDMGKHTVVVGAWGFVQDPASTLVQGNSRQLNPIFVNAGPKICAMLNALAPGSEPIGPINGRVDGMTPLHRTDMGVLNNLAFMRICMIDENSVISSIYSNAHPTSDYRKISSTLAANAILGQLRSICMPYIGRPYKDEEIASLSQTIDGVMKSMVSQDHAQRIDVSLSASRLDRINGILKASVRFIPPLSLEAITVEITLEPPAAGI
jgi:hypothetical protein